MKKAVLCGALLAMFLVPAAQAALTDLPDGYVPGWSGTALFGKTVAGGYLSGAVEFAVYDTQADGYAGFSAPGDNRFVYAYQIFADSSATAALTYFGLTGINPAALASAEENLGTDDSAGGIDAKATGLNLSKTKAYFEFDNGLLIQDEKSVFLLLGSNFLPKIGGFEVSPSADNDISVPGDADPQIPDNGQIPEPATLAMLLGGALLSLYKRR